MTDHPTTVMHRGGGNYTVVPDAAAPGSLPPGTYGLAFSPMTGYTITTLADLAAPKHRIYGRRDETVDKVLRAYRHFDRSLGVLFVGDKGIGKSLTTMEIARRARDEFALPVVMVTTPTPGLADYLAGLGEAVVVFDEFEKNFAKGGQGSDQPDEQSQFLGLLDGTDRTKRLYLVTVNQMRLLNDYFVNRPGRFHYLFDFAYPTADEVAEYLRTEARAAQPTDEQVAAISAFAVKARLNYDHLRAVVTELLIAGPELAPTLGLDQVVGDLNIRRESAAVSYRAAVSHGAGVHEAGAIKLDLFGSAEDAGITEQLEHEAVATPATPLGRELVRLGVDAAEFVTTFDPTGVEMAADGSLVLAPTGYGPAHGSTVAHGVRLVAYGGHEGAKDQLVAAAAALEVDPVHVDGHIQSDWHEGEPSKTLWVDLDRDCAALDGLRIAQVVLRPTRPSTGAWTGGFAGAL